MSEHTHPETIPPCPACDKRAVAQALADAHDCQCGHVLMLHDPTGRCHVIVDLLLSTQCSCWAFRTPAQAAALAAAPASPEPVMHVRTEGAVTWADNPDAVSAASPEAEE